MTVDILYLISAYIATSFDDVLWLPLCFLSSRRTSRALAGYLLGQAVLISISLTLAVGLRIAEIGQVITPAASWAIGLGIMTVGVLRLMRVHTRRTSCSNRHGERRDAPSLAPDVPPVLHCVRQAPAKWLTLLAAHIASPRDECMTTFAATILNGTNNLTALVPFFYSSHGSNKFYVPALFALSVVFGGAIAVLRGEIENHPSVRVIARPISRIAMIVVGAIFIVDNAF